MAGSNLPYDPAKQVPAAEIRAARDVLQRMLDAGELLAGFEGPLLRQALWVLDRAIDGANVRAERAGARTKVGD